MSISRIEIQGQVARTQDFTTIKHNEDNKTMVDQTNFQRQFNQTVENKFVRATMRKMKENGLMQRIRETEPTTAMAAGGEKRKRRRKKKTTERLFARVIAALI